MTRGREVVWYLKNRTKIDEFKKWLEVVETTELPREAAFVVGRAIEATLSSVDQIGFEFDTEWPASSNWWWYLRDGYEDDKRGSFIAVWLPKGSWLTSGVSITPLIGLYLGGTKAKPKTREFEKIVRSTIGKLRKYEWIGKDDDKNYLLIQQKLTGPLTLDALSNEKKLVQGLTMIFKEFTNDVLPAMKAVRKAMIG